MAFISSKRAPDDSRAEKASHRTDYGPAESERTAWTEQSCTANGAEQSV